jgi:hypothetical protein
MSDPMVVENRYGHPSHGDDFEQDALVRFDVSSIPAGTEIESATLCLYYYHWHDNNPAGRVLTCYRITDDWEEETVTWNTQPTCAAQPTSAATVPAGYDWMTWDVTVDVQAFINEEEPEYGWKIMDEEPWNWYNIPWTYFHTKEYGSYIPHLEVEFPGPDPSICRFPEFLANSCVQGESAPDQSFEVWNCGEGTLVYSISCQSSGGGGWQPYGDRYAIIVMGGNVDPESQHYIWYWGDTYGMYTELESYGFTAENIHFLSYGPSAEQHPEAVDGISTTENIRLAYQWAEQVCTSEDLLYIYWVDHGSPTAFQTNNGAITHAELGTLTLAISTKQLIGAYNPCYSGAVIDDVSGDRVITVTSQDAFHGNSWGWAGKWREALQGGTLEDPTDTNQDGYISMTEAYEWIAPKSQAAGEHSMYDDNGDGVGSEWGQPGFDPNDPAKDGYNGKFYSLDGWSAPLHAAPVREDGWLSCIPEVGQSTGEHDPIDVVYATDELLCGFYSGTITISDPDADNDPQVIAVDLTVDCLPADFDRDGDVDLYDHAMFLECLAGPNVPTPPGACSPQQFDQADLDGDDDVDLGDFDSVQVLFTG